MSGPGEFLYCIELAGQNIAKVGCSSQPHSRLAGLRQSAPFEMRFRRVLQVANRHVADAFEKHILQEANSYRQRGEWLTLDPYLDDLFESVAPAVDVTEDFTDRTPIGRRRMTLPQGESQARVLLASLKAQVGPVPAMSAAFRGGERDYQAAVVRARLSDGYGVEDILVKDAIPLDVSRAVIADLKAKGTLRDVLGLAPLPKPKKRASRARSTEGAA